MAKPLIKPQPRSSVAGMLEPGIGAQALGKPTERTLSILPTPITDQHLPNVREQAFPIKAERIADIPRQFSLSPGSDQILKSLISVYNEATGLDLRHSEFLRATLVAFQHALPQLSREAKEIGRLKRPKNDRAKKGIQEEMERRIAKAIIAGMRAVPVME